MSILLNSAIITAFSLLNQAFSKLNIPKSTFFPSELEFLNLYQSGYPSPDNFTELMNWTQFFIRGMTIIEYSEVFQSSDLDTFFSQSSLILNV